MVRKFRSPPLIDGLPPSEEFLDQTIKVWQPYSGRTLTHQDARDIATNMVGFFQLLAEWDREEKAPRSLEGPPMPGSEKSKIRLLSR
jgi:hypothetical protein